MIEGDLHALDFVAAAVVSETCDAEGLALACVGERYHLALCGLDYDGVEVLLVARCIRVAEESFCKGSVLFGDESWKDAVIPDVVVTVVFMVTDPDPLQPFDAASPDIAGDHDSDGIPMIRREGNIVHLVGENDIVLLIHGILKRDAGRVLAITWLVSAFKVDPKPFPALLCKVFRDSYLKKHVAHQSTLPVCATNTARSPAKTFAPANHVEFLASVAVAS